MSSSDATKAEGLSHIENKLEERGVAPTESSTTTSTTGDGTTVIGTIKSYLGFSSDASTDPASGSTTLPDRTREPTLGERTNENITPSAANASFDGSGDTKGAASENLASTTANESFESTGPSGHAASENLAPTEANKSFEAPGTSVGILPDPSTDGSVTDTGNEERIEAEKSSGKAKELVSGAASKALERPDAIPTAGGEKLGQKHWGESKVVPLDPKPHKVEAGVESKDGQPTAEVQDNTSKNTGGATGGPHGHGSGESAAATTTTTTTGTSSESAEKESVEKEKLTDKIKDKLHIGKK